jgi:cytochrome o ubiquinol oxidase operon protein cyoD
MHDTNQQPKQPTGHGTVFSYSIGFLLSLIMTMAAYLLVVNKLLEGRALIAALIALAIAQLFVQLIFFLHLGSESKPRMRLLIFLFMGIVLAIIVGGSIWIMDNLDYRMMPHEVDEYMLEEEGIRE